jgi:HlyD family secretion protein
VDQLKEQIEGFKAAGCAKADEIKLIKDELVGVEELWRKNLIRSPGHARSSARRRG